MTWRATVLTLFPAMFPGPLGMSLSGDALARGFWSLDAKNIRDHGLGVVGHTAFYLPIASSFESLRRAAVDELKRAAEFFAALGAKWMNVHPDGHAPFVDEATVVHRNIVSLQELAAFTEPLGVGVMLENVPGRFNSVAQLSPILWTTSPDANSWAPRPPSPRRCRWSER